jgi:ssDNA-binding Zn-finger/Zn-ribbon topoisomerase 1
MRKFSRAAVAGGHFRSFRAWAGALALGVSVWGGQASANVYDQPVAHIPIPLLDEQGAHVLQSGKAYSSRQSCGGCHDYESITHSFHFETGRDEASDDYGRMRGLDQLVSPGYFGGYNCMGSNNPERTAKKHNASAVEFADKGSAGLVMRCEGCHAGGGWMEKDRDGRRYDEVDPSTISEFDGDYYNRGTDENNQPADLSVVARWDWKKSGVVENNCFKCHADVNALIVPDPGIVTRSASRMVRNVRRSVLIDQGHFRESNSAILEAINLNMTGDPANDKTLLGFARVDLDGDGEISDDEVVFDEATGHPLINWNADAFDANGKVVIPMLRFPGNDNCMACHSTSNSRRGFYGFGEGAEATYDEDDGTLIEDYQDDVHKGKLWREANGEERTIENCNVCHARNYFNPASSSADVDANHNFLKGNSDMDVHNDLDYNPNAKSCEYCHEQSPQAAELANPSGDADMLSAHRKRWAFSGVMSGYPQDTIERITQSHLDVVSCQSCHITGKKARGRSFDPMFRYREDEHGVKTIVPYKPKPRYYWKDRNSGTLLTKTERNSVYREVYDADGNLTGGIIVDPETGEELATVSARISHGSVRFGDPETYEAFVGLKNAYDVVLKQRGVENPDAVLVWSEINQYLISHNTRPAVSSVQCNECHHYKSDGTTISALVSDDGIFGVDNRYEITTIVDPKLVDDGIILFDYPYMKMDENGVVTENAADILAYSRVDPSMTRLKSASADMATAAAEVQQTQDQIASALAQAGIDSADLDALLARFQGSYAYLFQSRQGDALIRDVLVVSPDENLSDHTLQVMLADDAVVQAAAQAGLGEMMSNSPVFGLTLRNADGSTTDNFNDAVLVKLPYSGSSNDAAAIRIITSVDGKQWQAVDAQDVLTLRAQTAETDGYVVFATRHFSFYALTSATASTTAAVSDESTSGSGGAPDLLWLMLLPLLPIARRRRFRH